ncbi:PREDICTED: non-specific lipid-transfer protein-like protein At2g13820 [Fragaria vesca subsp. vesca]|uniref:non-specific lipid-transfer protein-like protein At2g13820 n=1 Tax=Fragaria vesca subsp. vesca TaxID=101020 RepID=UPI0002C324FA|nr:PREDICTED: non-specific lipid-transfer protein-like protein At2g13820 [Fragaria vesca subsp. vesca]XP_011458583.1 PREDICTED: non-specific lipid-transfer protein-like protein At2g13820 [Fragaria vesca subsp. vesca]
MEPFKAYQPVLIVIISLLISVHGQISTPCTTTMLSTFTPCLNYITGSTSNGSSPTGDCCGALKSLMGTGMDCACLLVTSNVPVQLPINRTLALSLPKACKMGGVPLQCKASASPLPAPGPSLLGPTPSPTSDSPFSPRASKAVATAPTPESEADFPSDEPEAPTTAINRPVLTPSAASSLSFVSPQPLLLVVLGIMVYKSY